MARRFHDLLIALLAISGMLVRPTIPLMHEHDGGSDPHHHVALVGHVGHDHPDDDAAAGDPTTEDESSDEGGVPHNENRHGHFESAQAAAVRRMVLATDGADTLAGAVFSRVVLAYEQPGHEVFGQRPSPGDGRGFPQRQSGRTIDRLIQGIGLLI